jgi:hypothetical protein
MRQVAVFYHHDPNGLQSLWIFFHVGQGTPLQNELDKYALVSQRELRLDHAWLTLHSSVFSSYLGNWCTYVDSIGQHVDKQVSSSIVCFWVSLTFYSD